MLSQFSSWRHCDNNRRGSKRFATPLAKARGRMSEKAEVDDKVSRFSITPVPENVMQHNSSSLSSHKKF